MPALAVLCFLPLLLRHLYTRSGGTVVLTTPTKLTPKPALAALWFLPLLSRHLYARSGGTVVLTTPTKLTPISPLRQHCGSDHSY